MISKPIRMQKYESEIAPAGVCALIHGLNQKPEVLEPLIECLTTAGYSCRLLTLGGHNSDGWEELSSIKAQDWIGETHSFLHSVEEEARQSLLPMHFVGYSLGALVGLNTYRRYDDLALPERAVFLAPAFLLKRRSRLLKLVLPLLSRVPSFAPKEMRAHKKGLPVLAYKALFDLVDDLRGPWPQRLRSLKSLVVVDPKDELVGAGGFKKLFAEKNWLSVEIEQIDLACADKQAFHHLISSPQYLSRAEWKSVTRLMLGFLAKSSS